MPIQSRRPTRLVLATKAVSMQQHVILSQIFTPFASSLKRCQTGENRPKRGLPSVVLI